MKGVRLTANSQTPETWQPPLAPRGVEGQCNPRGNGVYKIPTFSCP